MDAVDGVVMGLGDVVVEVADHVARLSQMKPAADTHVCGEGLQFVD